MLSMKHLFVPIFLFVASCLLLCSCKNASDSGSSAAVRDNACTYELSEFFKLSEADIESADNIESDILTIPYIPIDEEYAQKNVGELMDISDTGAEMAYFVPFGDSVYYLYQHDVWTTMSKRWEIYRQNITTGEVSRSAMIENDFAMSFFSAAVSDKAIYYSALTADNEWLIIEFSPANGCVSVLLSGELSDDDRIPVLTCRDDRLSWYEVSDFGKIDLKVYDIGLGELSTAAENVISSNPYERTAGSAYAKNENGKAVVYYSGGIVDTGCASESFSLIAADSNRVIWSETLSNRNLRLYLYDCGNGGSGTAYAVTVANCMGAGIINDYFYVNSTSSTEGVLSSELMFADIGSKTVYRNPDNGFAWAYCFSENDTVGLCQDNKVYLYHIS